MITICDTGPGVAYLNRNDPYHRWAVALMKQLTPPLLTCEPVLTEAIYFLRLVAMTELHARCRVVTVDRKDFSVYRRNDRQTIDFVAPPAR